MKTKLFLFLFVAFLNSSLFASISKKSSSNSLTTTAIADSNFEQALINLGYDSGTVDGSVLTANISGVTTLTLQYLGITRLDGIEDFTALEEFSFYGNETALTDVDLSSNTNLKTLRINGFTNLTNLNITGLSSLIELSVTTSNMMNSLDFTGVDNLEKLHLQNLTTLASINVTNLISLKEFSTSGLVAITSYDLSTLVALENLLITNNNLLTSVNLKTGITANIFYVQFQGNDLLTCVEVDAGVPIMGMSTWNQNNGAIFNEDCNNPSTYVPDDNFEAFLEANAMGNGVLNDDKVTTANINTVSNLNISNQSISDLTGIQDFTALVELSASSNNLTSVDVSDNVLLENLFLNSNSLITISVAKNLALKQLWLRENNLTDLDVSKNTALEWLVCSKNNIESLDLSLNVNASFLELHTNNLSVLNLKNIANTTISYFDAQLNPSLTCVQVDDAAYWTANFSNQLDGSASFSTDCMYPTTSVPDTAFENYLETHDRDGNVVALGDLASMGNGTANDGEVYTHRINTVTRLSVSNIGLSLLTGLEGFRDLENFGAFGGNPGLITADFSNNTKLKRITFSLNSNATSITFGNLPDVEYVQLGYNNISNVDISGLPNLEEFKEFDGKINSLDTSGNPNLKILSIIGSDVNSLDLSANTNLETLNIVSSQLINLNLNSNLNLVNLDVSNNSITSLDLSKNKKIETLNLSNNQLASLNLKNSFNTLINTVVNPLAFNITNNPSLTCVEVDDATYSNANWTSKDAQHVFNTTCGSQQITLIPDPVFEQILINFNIDSDGVVNGQVFTSDIEYVGTLYLYCTSNCSSSTTPKITDLTGIEDFTSLITLEAGNNSIAGSLNLSNNTNLTRIRVQNNLITNLILGNNSNLKEIRAQGNNISAIDVSGNVNLEEINLDSNSLSTINLNQNTNLTKLYLNNNMLTTLDITNNNLLDNLHINNNQITSIDLTNKLNLSSFKAENNLLSGQIDFSNNTKLVYVHLNNNQLNTLDLSASVGLRLYEIRVANNSLVSLNLDNGYSQSGGPLSFDTRNNLNLKCIQVPDVSLYQWVTDIDPHTSFNTDCSTVWSVMTNPATTAALLAVAGLDADNDGEITIAEAAAYTGTLDLSGSGIADVEGLAAFTGITTLDVSGNGITDLSPLTGSSFNTIAKSTGKTKIVQKTTTMALQTLIASNNNFDVLDISSLSNLTTVDVSNNPNLVTLNMQNGNNANITSFTASNTPNLTCILVDDINASYLSTWSKDTKSEFVADATDCRSKVLSLENIDLNTNIVFYPNPVNDILSIKLSEGLNLQEVKVYSLSGKNVMKSNKSTLDFSRLSKGFYLVKIITDKGVSGKRIIKN